VLTAPADSPVAAAERPGAEADAGDLHPSATQRHRFESMRDGRHVIHDLSPLQDRVVCFVLLSAERLAILRVVVNAGVSRILGIRSALHCAWGPSGRAARRADLCTTPSCRGAPGSVTGRSPRRTFP